MKMHLELVKFENGKFRAHDGAEKDYLRLGGYDQNRRWAKMICYDSVAVAFHEKVNALCPADEDVASRRLAFEVEGEWMERPRLDKQRQPVLDADGRAMKDRSFRVVSFKHMTGPAVEIVRTRADASSALDASASLAAGGDMAAAYRTLEAFVAAVARRPAPSAGVAEDLDDNAAPAPSAAPEEAAEAALAKREASSRPAAPRLPTSKSADEANQSGRDEEHAEESQTAPGSEASAAGDDAGPSEDAPPPPAEASSDDEAPIPEGPAPEEQAPEPAPAPAPQAAKPAARPGVPPMPPRPGMRPGMRPPMPPRPPSGGGPKM